MTTQDFNAAKDVGATRALLLQNEDAAPALLSQKQPSARALEAVAIAQMAMKAVFLADSALDYSDKELKESVNEVMAKAVGFGKRFPDKVDNEAWPDWSIVDALEASKKPAATVKAEAVLLAAQVYFNNEVSSIRDQMNSPGYVAGALSAGAVFTDGFRIAAKELITYAAGILKDEKHTKAAEKLESLSKTIIGTPGKNSPAECMGDILWSYHKGSQSLAIVLSDERYYDDETPYSRALEKLQVLTALPLSAAAYQAPKPKDLKVK